MMNKKIQMLLYKAPSPVEPGHQPRADSHLIFHYSGINQFGKKATGTIQAKSLLLAQLALYDQGFSQLKIRKKRKSWLNRITQAHISQFTRALATLTCSGIPLAQALKLVAQIQKHKPLKELIKGIHLNVEAGFSLSEALRKQPEYFNKLFCTLTQTGELSGCLNSILEDLASYKERIEGLKKSIKKALLYPLTILGIALIVVGGLLLFAIPQFQSLFSEFKAELPPFTQKVVHISEFFQVYWLPIGSFLALSLAALLYAKKRSPTLAKTLDALLLGLPFIGSFFKKTILARFARTLSLAIRSGLPLVSSLEDASGLSANLIFEEEIKKLAAEIASGQTMSTAMRQSSLFPQLFIQMVALGEEAGPEALEKMLHKLARIYEEEMDQLANTLNHLLEPLLICFLGILIGGLVIALYLPLFQLGQII